VASWSRKEDLTKAIQGLALTAEEGFVLSRFEMALTREQVIELTALPGERIDIILALLEDKGLIVNDLPSIRPAEATIPDESDSQLARSAGDDGDDDVFDDETAPWVKPSAVPPAWTEPPPRARSLDLGDACEVWNDAAASDEARALARELIRTTFTTAPPEDRAALIYGTDGNVLAALTGLNLDGRTTAILCSRSYTSVAFVRNIVKFNACPGQLLAHLSKQAFVRRNPQLRNMLLQHSNLPPDVKRRG
jgi:hypothetical protein